MLAQEFVGGLTRDTFADDTRTRYAVMRCLEIISEASRRLDPGTRARYPHLPWRAIAAAGNVYRHEYKSVRAELVWDTVSTALPELLSAVEAELARNA